MECNRLTSFWHSRQIDSEPVQPRVPFVLSCFRTPLIAGGLLALAAALRAQTPQHVEMERSGFVIWLKEGSNSPLSAIAQQKVGDGLRLGPADADVPLSDIGEYRVYPEGAGLVL